MENSSTDHNRIFTIKQLLDEARRRLVETGTRNRLVHVNRERKRANVLNIINERSEDIFEIIRAKNKKMKFLAKGSDEELESDEEPLFHFIEAGEFDEARYKDNLLETPLGPDALQKRLLRLSRDAKTAEEEQGLNILYLALGFLTWYEDEKSDVKREAPLILLPVSLVRNETTSAFDIISRDDDLVANLPLQERLKSDFGLNLPEIEEDDFSPEVYFEQISEIIQNQKDWEIDRDGMQLGFFSFAKLLMLRDLDPSNWANDGLLESALLSDLLTASYVPSDPLFGPEDKLDEKLQPGDIIQVVDADASQTKVIEEVRSGRDLVVQGPPGTGKSQTITNIIASAVHDGKKVLFMAEKMAALSVVHQRLVKAGLRNVCLELHSKNANKKSLIGELSRTLNEASTTANMPSDPEKLKYSRDRLNSFDEMMHTDVPGTHFSPFQILSKLILHLGSEDDPPVISEPSLSAMSAEEINIMDRNLGLVIKILGKLGPVTNHPFYGYENLNLQPTDLDRVSGEIEKATSNIEKLLSFSADMAEDIGVNTASNLDGAHKLSAYYKNLMEYPQEAIPFIAYLSECDDLKRLCHGIQHGIDWSKAKKFNEAIFQPSAFEQNLNHLRAPITAGATSFFARLGSNYRRASKELALYLKIPIPSKAPERLSLLDSLSDVVRKRQELKNEENFLSHVFGSDWRGEKTDFAAINGGALWFNKASQLNVTANPSLVSDIISADKDLGRIISDNDQNIEQVRTSVKALVERLDADFSKIFETAEFNELPLENIEAEFSNLSSNIETYEEWVSLNKAMNNVQEMGLSELLEMIEEGQVDVASASKEFHYALAEALWEKAREKIPELADLNSISREELVEEFKSLEADRIDDTKKIIYQKHINDLPRGAVGEMAVVRGEIGKKRRHKPIRKLIETAGKVIQRIKPVFLMSPISIAQFIPPETLEFDLLVIDEASQVRPEDALGAIARCRQIVVVGDQQQLPPTSFFSRLTSDLDDEDDEENEDPLAGAARATELESILALCEARGLNRRMLEWHYRSRDPSLIKVSNAEFYESGLVLPPSPLEKDKNFGLKFTRVPGVYARGRQNKGRISTNKIEAQKVVEAIQKHCRKWPELSLGVVTFSVKQRDMVNELLEHARREDKKLDAFLRDGRNEDVFVKNIENVQGDERDVIFISVGYGPQEPNGRLKSMHFGPVNRDGGERRLNVLFSRSRVRCEIFASFDPGDIDLNRTTKEGPRVLKRFLEFAKTGLMEEHIPTGKDYDSPFEEDVANEIRKLGYEVDTQVGSGGFVIDLAIKHHDHSGQYMLAVECDGATYHSALWARERDRLRQGVLEGLGWSFHRIWSTDWFHKRSKEIDRLKKAIGKASKKVSEDASYKGANAGSAFAVPDSDTEVPTISEIQPLDLEEISVPKYVAFDELVSTTKEPHEVSDYALAPIIKQIIQAEGPIHSDEIARRLAGAFGKTRAGQRINAISRRVLNGVSRNEGFSQDEDFWFTDEQAQNIPIRNRSELSGSILKAEYLPHMEIKAATKLIIENSGEVENDDLVRALSRLFGFQRAGPDLKKRISEVLNIEGQE